MAIKTKKHGDATVVYYRDEHTKIDRSNPATANYVVGFVVKSTAHIKGKRNPDKSNYIAFHSDGFHIYENPVYFKDESAAVKSVEDDCLTLSHWQKAEWGWVAAHNESATCLHKTAQDAIDELMTTLEEDHECDNETPVDDALRENWLDEIEVHRAFNGDMLDLLPSILSHVARGIEIAEQDELANESYESDIEAWHKILREAEPAAEALMGQVSFVLRCVLEVPFDTPKKQIPKVPMLADKAKMHRWPRWERREGVLRDLEVWDALLDVMWCED